MDMAFCNPTSLPGQYSTKVNPIPYHNALCVPRRRRRARSPTNAVPVFSTSPVALSRDTPGASSLVTASQRVLRTLGVAAAGIILSTTVHTANLTSLTHPKPPSSSSQPSALELQQQQQRMQIPPVGVEAANASALVGRPFRLAPAIAPDTGGGISALLQAHWDLHSTTCDTETFVVLSNESSHVVDLWWVDYVGTEVFYGSINPGMTFLQQTFASHPWVVRDHVSQNSVLVLVATAEPLMAVVHSV